MGRLSKQYHYHWQWTLSSSPEALWPLVADTNRFNMDVGLPRLDQKASANTLSNARRHLRFSKLGVTVEWIEEPFEWVEPRTFGVRRQYSRGPVEEMRVLACLDPLDDGGTELTYEVWATPRNFLGLLAIPLQIGILSARSFAAVFKRYDEQAAAATTSSSATGISSRVGRVRFIPGGEQRLEVAADSLASEGIDTGIASALADIVRRGDDITVSQLRPYELADVWGLQRRSVLEACLVATRLGLLEFEWHLLCPLCRGAKARTPSLAGVEPQVHCETCNIDFEVNFDRAVEITFHPNPSIRNIVIGEFCIAGPRVTPHVVAQQLIAAGEEREVSIDLERGRYRLRALQLAGGQHIASTAGASAAISVTAREGWSPDELIVRNEAILELQNGTAEEQLLILERLALSDQAVTGAEVTALQRFRDLFATEALRPGERISVGSLTVVFTDLYGSTQLYNEIGDATAFGLVMTHFDVLKEAIASLDGTLIKTMGDAVMAVFPRPLNAVQAILRAQAALATSADERGRFQLKAGIHFGPCIAVTMNGRLDYFGSTVNIASRLEKFSQGDDIVISDAIYNDEEVSSLLENDRSTFQVERIDATLKGFDGERFALKRVAVATPGGPPGQLR